jgi:hypothetical protein
MKRAIMSIAIVLFLILYSPNLYSLTNFNFKCLALDNTGQVLPETPVDIRISISDDTGTLYQETHTGVTTDQFGFFTVEVGNGTVISGDLGDITVASNTRISCETRKAGFDWVLSSIESIATSMRTPFIDISKYVWVIEGNDATIPGTNFIGTTDDSELHIDVRNGGTVEQSLRINTDQAIYRESGITGNVAGNERGDGSVDLQISRTDATQVASGINGVIRGGKNNKIESNGRETIIGGGQNNTSISLNGALLGGRDNQLGTTLVFTDENATIIGGRDNISNDGFATVGGGRENTASSNAPLLNFTEQTVFGGNGNIAGGIRSVVFGGQNNKALSTSSVFGGQNNQTICATSVILGGRDNESTCDNVTFDYSYSMIAGGYKVKTDKYGQNAYASGQFDNQGDAQTSLFVVRNETSDNSVTNLYLDGTNELEKMNLIDQSIWNFKVLVIGKNDDGTIYGSYEINGVIINNGGVLAINGIPAEADRTIYETDSGLDATAVVNGTALAIQVTGLAATTMHWVARVKVSQLNY